MKIRAITMNAAGLMAGRPGQDSQSQAQTVKDPFGPRYKVSISKEGKELSRRQTAHGEENAQSSQSINALRKLMRQEEQDALQQEQDVLQQDLRQGYQEEIKDIADKIKMYNSVMTMSGEQDILFKKKQDIAAEKKQDVLGAMNDQKAYLAQESEKRAKEAQQLAMQAAGYQEEVDEDNRDLVTLLRTMEEADKAKEERENGENVSLNGNGGDSGKARSVSDMIQGSAAQFMTTSVEREWKIQEMLAGYGEEGRQLLEYADTVTRDVVQEGENILAAMEDEAFTDEEIDGLMEVYRRSVGLEYADDEKLKGSYEDVYYGRVFGHQILRDARENRIEHLAGGSLGGMLRARNSMILSAADAAVNEAAGDHLGEASQDLAKEAQSLIDERNSIDRFRQNREEEKEEQEKEAEELLNEERLTGKPDEKPAGEGLTVQGVPIR